MTKLKLYRCPVCQLAYKDRNLASKCQIWCQKHKSCNLEITKYSVNKKTL